MSLGQSARGGCVQLSLLPSVSQTAASNEHTRNHGPVSRRAPHPASLPATFLNSSQSPQHPRHAPASPLWPSSAGAMCGRPPPRRAPRQRQVRDATRRPMSCGAHLGDGQPAFSGAAWRVPGAPLAVASAPQPLISASRAAVEGPRVALTCVSRVGMALSPPVPRMREGDRRETPPRLPPVVGVPVPWCPVRAGGRRSAAPFPGRPPSLPLWPCGGWVSAWPPHTCPQVVPRYLRGFAAFRSYLEPARVLGVDI